MEQLKITQKKIDNYRQIILNDIKQELENSLSSIGKINSKTVENANFKTGFLGEYKPSQSLNLYYKLNFYHIEKWFSKSMILEVYVDINVKEDKINEVRVLIFDKDAFNLVNEQVIKLQQKYQRFLTSCNFTVIKKFE